jgi:cell division protein ZapA
MTEDLAMDPMDDEGRVIPVDIQGQRYPIRTALEPEYVARLARYVDEKITAAAETTPTGDFVRLTVVAALNLADELFRLRDASRDRDGRLAERAEELEQMLDRVLMA